MSPSLSQRGAAVDLTGNDDRRPSRPGQEETHPHLLRGWLPGRGTLRPGLCWWRGLSLSKSRTPPSLTGGGTPTCPTHKRALPKNKQPRVSPAQALAAPHSQALREEEARTGSRAGEYSPLGGPEQGGLGLCLQVLQEAAEGRLPGREPEVQAALLLLQVFQPVSYCLRWKSETATEVKNKETQNGQSRIPSPIPSQCSPC